MVRGQAESVWPVIGSPWVADGLVIAVAGRHSLLDGGLACYALDTATGAVRWSVPLGSDAKPMLADTVAGDARGVTMGSILQLDPATGKHGAMSAEFALWAPNTLMAENTAKPSLGGNDTARAFWHYTPPRGGGFSGVTWANNDYGKTVGARGNILCFTATHVYGFEQNDDPNIYGFVKSDKPSATGSFLFGRELATRAEWQQPLALPKECRFNALILAGNRLVIGGATGSAAADAAGASAEGATTAGAGDAPSQGLQIHDAATGSETGRLALPAAPLWNGLAAAGGRVFVSTRDGRLVCFAGAP